MKYHLLFVLIAVILVCCKEVKEPQPVNVEIVPECNCDKYKQQVHELSFKVDSLANLPPKIKWKTKYVYPDEQAITFE